LLGFSLILHPLAGSYIILTIGMSLPANSQASLGLRVFSLFYFVWFETEDPAEKEEFPKAILCPQIG
jgi:hypothetical protein